MANIPGVSVPESWATTVETAQAMKAKQPITAPNAMKELETGGTKAREARPTKALAANLTDTFSVPEAE